MRDRKKRQMKTSTGVDEESNSQASLEGCSLKPQQAEFVMDHSNWQRSRPSAWSKFPVLSVKKRKFRGTCPGSYSQGKAESGVTETLPSPPGPLPRHHTVAMPGQLDRTGAAALETPGS